MTGELLPGGASNQAELDASLRCVRAAFLGLVPGHIPETTIEESVADAAVRAAERMNHELTRTTNQPSAERVRDGFVRGARRRSRPFAGVAIAAFNAWGDQQKTA